MKYLFALLLLVGTSAHSAAQDLKLSGQLILKELGAVPATVELKLTKENKKKLIYDGILMAEIRTLFPNHNIRFVVKKNKNKIEGLSETELKGRDTVRIVLKGKLSSLAVNEKLNFSVSMYAYEERCDILDPSDCHEMPRYLDSGTAEFTVVE